MVLVVVEDASSPGALNEHDFFHIFILAPLYLRSLLAGLSDMFPLSFDLWLEGL